MRTDALSEVARLSNERKTGARGLRAILETSMMDYMYELPSMDDVKECIITKAVIDGEGEPKLLGVNGEEPQLPDKGRGKCIIYESESNENNAGASNGECFIAGDACASGYRPGDEQKNSGSCG